MARLKSWQGIAEMARTTTQTAVTRTRTVVGDMASGFFEITHNGFALVGLVMAIALATVATRPDLRTSGEGQLLAWLQDRQEAGIVKAAGLEGVRVDPDASGRATAVNVADLPKQQALVAHWISRKYGVAPEPIGALVAEAYEAGSETKLDPLLILAIMATESSFNPYAQSPVGAQGLMQVMTHIHRDKYEAFGGKLAAFDPRTNLRVGVKVLQECIQRAGGLEAGLKYYVGAAFHDNDGGYAAKVLSERARLAEVASGKVVSPLSTAVAQVSNPAVAAAKPELVQAVREWISPVSVQIAEVAPKADAPAAKEHGKELGKEAHKEAHKEVHREAQKEVQKEEPKAEARATAL